MLLPAWWTAKGTKLRLSARAQVKSPKMQGGNGLSLDEVVRFDWQVALGDQSLSREDLMALAKLKVPLVRVRGQWVLLDAGDIKDAIALLKRKDKGLTGRDALRIALGGQAGGAAGGESVAVRRRRGAGLARRCPGPTREPGHHRAPAGAQCLRG